MSQFLCERFLSNGGLLNTVLFIFVLLAYIVFVKEIDKVLTKSCEKEHAYVRKTNNSPSPAFQETEHNNGQGSDKHHRFTINPTFSLIEKDDYFQKVVQPRIGRALDACATIKSNKQFTNMNISGVAYGYKDKNLVYCITPKVGSTFWKKIFRFINHDNETVVAFPADIPRQEVHYGKTFNTPVYQLSDHMDNTVASYNYTFMFTRDPYSRLWSAYNDKIFLPDFWRSAAKSIMKSHANATELQYKCANTITFREFVEYVVQTIPKGQDMNSHWCPVYRVCNPCHFRLDFIGKLETFATDTRYILQRSGLQHILSNIDLVSHALEEVTSLIRYNFNLKQHYSPECFDIFDVAKRLWKVFQYNGYIDVGTEFPFEISTFTGKKFEDYIVKIVTEDKMPHDHRKSQRRAALENAYQRLPNDLLDGLQDAYKIDFKIFGYSDLAPSSRHNY